jgi:polysaccharide biosynthesis protein PslH
VDILYISHCVPWPPDKGERIRAYHSVRCLVEHHRVHLACLARSEQEERAQSELASRCSSVRIHRLEIRKAFGRGLSSLITGGCFTAKFYESPALKAYCEAVVRDVPIRAVVLLSSGMALYAPESLPYIADWGDVDSEKRLEYAKLRLTAPLQRLEGLRLRRVERSVAMRSWRTFLTTPRELRLFERIAPAAPSLCCGNGVDFGYFNQNAEFDVPEKLRNRKFLVFVGILSYFPNANGIRTFAEEVFPELRRRDPDLELVVVGRNPSNSLRRLAKRDGITVAGAVDDVRPYIAAARAVVVPLRIARGIQNKVLEALAMGKTVLASQPICESFEPDVPLGIVGCQSVDDYATAVSELPETSEPNMTIIAQARARFDWASSLEPLVSELRSIEAPRSDASPREKVCVI